MSNRGLFVAIIAWFLLTRALCWSLGISMPESTGWLSDQWQAYDLEFLRTDLLRTLWYGHAQPPLYNLLLGVLLKILPAAALTSGVQAVWLLLSLGVCLAMLALLRTVGTPPRWAVGAVALYAVAPSLITFENYAFNTMPSVFGLTLFALALVKADQAGSRRWALVAIWAFAGLCLLRSSYHVVVLLGIAAFLLWRCGWRTLLPAAAVPVVLVIAVLAKNLALFGVFGSSSWLGMNAYNAVRIAPPQVHLCVAQRVQDTISSVVPFRPLSEYAAILPPLASKARGTHPVLDDAVKPGSRSGAPNFNHWQYLEISQRYGRAFGALLACSPADYLQSVKMAFVVMAMPADESRHTFHFRKRFERYAVWYDRLVFWSAQASVDPRFVMRSQTGYLVFPVEASLVVLLFLGALVVTWVRLTVGAPVTWLAGWPRASLWILATLVLGHVLVSNLLEMGENNRFRFEWEPLMAVLLASVRSRIRRAA